MTLTSASSSRTAITNVEGQYRFTEVGPGAYELTFALNGLETVTERVTLGAERLTGAEPLVLPDAELRVVVTENITFTCSASCNDTPPTSWSDYPSCADYDLDSALIDGVKSGDRSALQMIEQRYASADTYHQRFRLAGTLLGRSPNDAAIWKELIELADFVLRFPNMEHEEAPEEYVQWCAARGLVPLEHWGMAIEALYVASEDPRSKPLLMRILKDEKPTSLLFVAIEGLAAQRDFEALPAIDQALARAGDEGGQFAFSLSRFADERADAIAKKYLSEMEAITYDEWR